MDCELIALIVLVGDFNISAHKGAKLKEYVRKNFNLVVKNYPTEKVAFSGSCMDSTSS